MGFWGMSRTGKDAKNQLIQNANWQTGQARQASQNSADSIASGKANSTWATDYWKNKANNGFASTSQIQQSGQELMPGVDPAIAARWKRLDQKRSDWDTMVPKAGDIMPQITANLDQQGGNIGTNYDDNASIIKQGTDNLNYLADTAYQDSLGSIRDSYDAAQGNMGAAYDSMGNRIEGNYGGLIKESGDVYGKMGANVDAWGRTVEDLKPGSEASVATTARQFAPMLSAAGGRLRRAGVDPNSIQASAVLGDVEARRAVAMDDKAAEGQQTYINAQGQLMDARNNVLQGGFASKAGLTTDMTGQLTGLGRERAGIQTGLDLGRGEAFRGEITGNRDVKMGIYDKDRGLNLTNTNDSFRAGQALLDKRNDSTLLGRDLAMSDYATQGGLLDQANAEELIGLGLKKDQTLMGLDYQTRDENTRDKGAGMITQQGENDQNRGLQWDAAAQQWVNGSNQATNSIYSTEAANAGWGLKGLMGIGGSALGAWIGRKK